MMQQKTLAQKALEGITKAGVKAMAKAADSLLDSGKKALRKAEDKLKSEQELLREELIASGIELDDPQLEEE